MKKPSEAEKLLRDVLRTEEGDAFREALSFRCRKELARRRRRRVLWSFPAAASILFVLWLIHGWVPDFDSGKIEEKAPSYIVHTASLPAERVINSSPIQQALIVRTEYARPVVRLSDEQMLAYFPGAPCGLVQTGMGSKELVFLDAEQRASYFGEESIR